MPLQKTPVSINFSKGLNTKSDPYQVPIGNFLALNNSVFTVEGRLTKRNGYSTNNTALPNANQTTLTTLNDNLLATGSDLYSYNANSKIWYNKGIIQPVQLSTQPIVRAGSSQTSPDAAVSAQGLICTSYTDTGIAYYEISDSTTGEQVVNRVSLGTASFDSRVFLLGQYFVITYVITIGGANHLRFIAIPVSSPTNPRSAVDISTTLKTSDPGYDGIVANNTLYVGYATASNTVDLGSISSTLVVASPAVMTGHTANLMSVTADESQSTAVIWISFWDSGSNNGYTAVFNQNLLPILAPTQFLSSVVINELSSISTGMSVEIIYENNNTYGSGPNSSLKTDYISKLSVSQSGTVGSPTIILRSIGLASKPFLASNGTIYLLAAYQSTNQPSYFLIDDSGNVYMRLAYSNGIGYEPTQVLPSVSSYNSAYIIPYSLADQVTSVNKGTNLVTGVPTSVIFASYGINIAVFTINSNQQYSSEIAGSLHLTGGQLWQYDAVKPVEHGFQVWPDDVGATTSSTGGNMTAQVYYYQFTYEWTDNAGNIHRSAPSIPLKVDLSASGTSTNEVTLYVPTLRLTYKTSPNPVRIVGYRWSTAQQVYYQFTSITSPITNSTSSDLVTITDGSADSSIIGNAIVYTTGGVVEDIAAPASIATALFNNRLFLVDAEDRNLLWFSKQVIENVPVEMSDLLTLYIAPTSGAQGSTGPITALGAMDDKLIIFKKDAIYYINGTGPDNTGANSTFSDPIFITSAVGSANPSSIVLMPNGLMFQSDKGIWLLGRDLSTNYIGFPVEAYNTNVVNSAQTIPGTNQVRFVLDNNVTLMYDFYYGQWGTFNNTFGISATLYNGLHTYLNKYGKIFQESPGSYLDDSTPVLLSFTTSWISVAGLQGYERFYFANLLGTYITPFKLDVQLAYDYNPNETQSITVNPDNYTPNWGGDALWGSNTAWGGPGNVFSARLFPTKQKCQSFQVSINEIFDPQFSTIPGAGLTLSGLALIVGIKKGYRTQSARRSYG